MGHVYNYVILIISSDNIKKSVVTILMFTDPI